MKRLSLRCRACGATMHADREQDEYPVTFRVIGLRYDTSGELRARLECGECGHQWQTDHAADQLRSLPGYKQAMERVEHSAVIAPPPHMR